MKKEGISIRKLVVEYFGDMSETSNEENYTLEDPRFYRANRDSSFAAVIQNGHFSEMFLVEDPNGVKLCTHPVRGYLTGDKFIDLYIPGYDDVDELALDHKMAEEFDLVVAGAILSAFYEKYFEFVKQSGETGVDMVDFQKETGFLPSRFFSVKNRYMSSKQLAYKTLEDTLKNMKAGRSRDGGMFVNHDNFDSVLSISRQQLGKLIDFNMQDDSLNAIDAKNQPNDGDGEPAA